MTVTIPPQLRLFLYVFTALGTPVMIYLMAKDYIGDPEMILWGAEVTAISALAGFNTPRDQG